VVGSFAVESALAWGWLALALGMAVVGLGFRRKCVAARRATALTLESVTELASDAIVVINDHGKIVAWNAAATRVFGHERAAVMGTAVSRLIPEWARQGSMDIFRGMLSGEIVPPKRPVELVCGRRDGSEFPAEVSASVFARGDRTFVVVIFRDITAHKETLAALRASTELAEGVLNSATEYAIIATDVDGVITVFSRGAERMLGYAASDVVGVETPLVFHDADEVTARAWKLDAPQVTDALFAAAREGDFESAEWTYVRKDGSRFPVTLTVNAMLSADGTRCGYICIAHDLSAQRRAERLLAVSNEAFRKAFDSAPVAVVLTRMDMTCAHVNPAFCAMTGYDAHALRAMAMTDLMVYADDEERDRQIAEFDPLLRGEVAAHHNECRVRRADGSVLWAMVHTSIVTDETGKPVLVVTHLEDVTEQRAREDAARVAFERKVEAVDRLEELDKAKSTFVSMVSHELRTPVTSILGYLELLGDGDFGPLTLRQHEALSVVRQSTARLDRLVADLTTLSQFEAPAPRRQYTELVDTAALVSNMTAAMMPVLARRRHRLEVDIDQSAGPVLGDERQLEHVVSNLLTNASKFTPEGGTIVVRTRSAGNEVLISVQDTGIGIAPEEQEAVFTRFYRGRAHGGERVPGTGLGLSIVQGIVGRHNGRVSLESELGVGTTVTVALPCLEHKSCVAAAEGRTT